MRKIDRTGQRGQHGNYTLETWLEFHKTVRLKTEKQLEGGSVIEMWATDAFPC